MKKTFIVALLLVIIGGLIGYHFNTDGGDIAVSDIRIVGKDGKILSALLYVPSNATNETPAPAVVGMHGYVNSRETQDAFAIEFARRGYVFLALDMTGHGNSDQIIGDSTRGFDDAIGYIRNLSFVDRENVALEGHSMGGMSVCNALVRNEDKVKAAVIVSSSYGLLGGDKITSDTKANFAVVFGVRDEFGPWMWEVPHPRELGTSAKLKSLFNKTGDEVVLGKVYGSFADKTARQWLMPNTTHAGAHFDKEAIGDTIQFVEAAMAPPRKLDLRDQIWPGKEFGNGLILMGLLVFMAAMASWLIQLPYFKCLIQPMPVNNAAMNTKDWWMGALVGTVISGATLFEFQNILLWKSFAFFTQNITNAILCWALLNALIGVALFVLWYYVIDKSKNIVPKSANNVTKGGI